MRRIVIKVRAAAVLLALGVMLSLMAPNCQRHNADDRNRRCQHPFRSQHPDRHPRWPLRGQTVTAISSSPGWTKISYDGSTAYVASAYLTKGKDLPPPLDRPRHGQGHHHRPQPSRGPWPLLPGDQGPQGRGSGDDDRQDRTRLGPAGQRPIHRLVEHAVPRQLDVRTAAIIGKRVATADLDIRTTSGTDSRTVTEVKKGTALSVTGAIQNGRAQIIYKGAIRWVTARYLTKLTSNLPSPPRLPKIIGTRYATATLDIRSTYADNYRLITEVPRATELKITGVVKNGRMQIIFDKAVRWVTAKYLSKSAPSSIPSSWLAVERGLQPNAIKVHRAMRARFPRSRCTAACAHL